jgi:hypothetical protein
MGLLDEKKRNNIASYVISMWHVEDVMRANDLDPRKVEEQLIAPIDADEEKRAEVREWYADIIEQMKEQGLHRHGHLAEVEEVMNDLEFLHNTLVDVLNDAEYEHLFAAAKPGISALQTQAAEDADGPITTCFTAIYGVMLLRAQGKEISANTIESEGHMRNLLERLSVHYKQMRKLPGVSMN